MDQNLRNPSCLILSHTHLRLRSPASRSVSRFGLPRRRSSPMISASQGPRCPSTSPSSAARLQRRNHCTSFRAKRIAKNAKRVHKKKHSECVQQEKGGKTQRWEGAHASSFPDIKSQMPQGFKRKTRRSACSTLKQNCQLWHSESSAFLSSTDTIRTDGFFWKAPVNVLTASSLQPHGLILVIHLQV